MFKLTPEQQQAFFDAAEEMKLILLDKGEEIRDGDMAPIMYGYLTRLMDALYTTLGPEDATVVIGECLVACNLKQKRTDIPEKPEEKQHSVH